MSSQSPEKLPKIPLGLAPPVVIDPTMQQHDFFNGPSVFRIRDKEMKGRARLFLDLLPIPEIRFEFEPELPLSMKESFVDPPFGEGNLEAGPMLGSVNIEVTHTGKVFTGDVNDQNRSHQLSISSARFIVINGPHVYGSPIKLGGSAGAGRLQATVDDLDVTIDLLDFDRQERRAIYKATHVIQCRFDAPITLDRLKEIRTNLFRSLSLMRCRWVGILGPWLYDEADSLIGLEAAVTKTARNSSSISWCHDSMRDSFSQLFAATCKSFSDPARSDSLQTVFHWLIEAEQCAGGVEGAIILQQAALECLAWLEIVQQRGMCSASGFKSLPASDKIRWLLSLSQISANIPAKSDAIGKYAKEFNMKDLIETLVDVRNALIHAEPKTAARLFSRTVGDNERSELWYQIGGLLQQAILASLGYRGTMLRRDVEAQYATGAVRPVPWVP